ncbi:uncharacterized protein LOC142540951 isoform X2 [Primulina tabacum]|uniref:uncharacterized protein LOC142540951 isoform X2 n=1 Tax=Primulina tabacum TaxID=48773 RepID=UPI003F5A9654
MEGEYARLSHLFVTVFLFSFQSYMVIPTIADVTVGAVCGGRDECSLAIYLTGFQQAISGLGSVVMMPLLGNLSDSYGRKKLLAIPMSLAIMPLVILALKRTKNWVYAYYAFKTFTAMVTDGGVLCLSFGSLAESVSEEKRVAVFSVLYGVVSSANVLGNLGARFLSTSQIFQVGAFVSILALVYMRIFVKDSSNRCSSSSSRDDNIIDTPLTLEERTESCNTVGFLGTPSPKDIFHLFNTSITFALAASVTLFGGLADAGAQTFLPYFLKARFGFNKDQFAVMFLIINIGAALSNVVFMPKLGPLFGEITLLSFALFIAFLNMLLNSLSWAPWVPYAAASLGIFFTIWSSCATSIASKQVGLSEQGIAQGCMMGIISLANVASPLIFSPLSALFLSEEAPFHFSGFCVLCIGLCYVS